MAFPFYSYLKGIDARKAECEAGRMLYVAATRAKHELHINVDIGDRVREGQLLATLEIPVYPTFPF